MGLIYWPKPLLGYFILLGTEQINYPLVNQKSSFYAAASRASFAQ
jgi:hypothetical protein